MKSPFVAQWIEDFLGASRLRANSLIVTVFGDAIAPHGGSVWLGSFIKLVEPLGLNPRMVRTSVYRLSKEKWLTSRQIGRCSYYSLTPGGSRRFEHATRRIYHAHGEDWNGEWLIVFTGLPGMSPSQRDELKSDLLWEGFGVVAPGVLAHPQTDSDSVTELLREAGVQDKAVVMRASSLIDPSAPAVQALARACWNLEAIAGHYQRFLDRFRPLLRTLRDASGLDPQQCFLVRTLLIHEYRRVLLRDPQLPAPLLPAGWPGETARQLCAELYRLTWKRAEQHLMGVLETADGRLPEAAPYFYQRFGGLEAAQELSAA